ncbi:beta-N-acetylhexosaminidase [Chitinophaga parva]|nr:beta-N-acetylhexosaminidase [Chitinophaga parva]
MMKKHLLTALALLTAATTFAQEALQKAPAIIPAPRKITVTSGSLALPAHVLFTTPANDLAPQLVYINDMLGGSAAYPVELSLTGNPQDAAGYKLHIDRTGIKITGNDKDGLFNGLVTLLQLCKTNTAANGSITLPCLDLDDVPSTRWRGFMLDEARHFFGKAAVKQLLDWMAFYKLNRFHWHLSDAQGWRIAIQQYPKLTSIGGTGNFTDSTAAARFYTQDDIREIVAYAKTRNIEIIPEIDMPGHASAATRAYPELSGGNAPGGYDGFTFNPAAEYTYQFLGNVTRELLQLFPFHTIHIGGDEVALGIKAWENNAAVQQMMQQQGFHELKEVEAYFLKRIADTVIAQGGSVFAWDEAASGNLPSTDAGIMWWRQNITQSLMDAQERYNVVYCPRLPFYFDFIQDSTHVSGRTWGKEKLYNRYSDVYNFPADPAFANLVPRHPFGMQANLWTETVITGKRLQFLVFPRLAAFSEAAWTEAFRKNLDAFNLRLQQHLPLYDQAGIYYYDPFDPHKHAEPVDVPVKPQVND